MLIDPTYSFNGGFRLSLGLPSPLYAGALLLLIHFSVHWIGEQLARTRAARSITTAILGLTACAIGLTGSRTALATLAVSLGYLALCERKALKAKTPWLSLNRMAVIAGAVLIGLIVSGTWIRLSGHYLSGDPSALNRRELWLAAFSAFGAAPIGGIGADQSAFTYSNWYAPIDKTVLVTGFSSTLFTLGIEHGFVIFTFLCLLLALPIAAPWLVRRSDDISASVAAGCVALLLSLSATTLTLSLHLIGAEVAFGLFALIHTALALRYVDPTRRTKGLCTIAAIVLLGAICVKVIPSRISSPDVARLEFHSKGGVRISTAHRGNALSYLWLSDPEITGPNFGHLYRKLIQAAPMPATYQLVLHDTQIEAALAKNDTNTVVLLGSARVPRSSVIKGKNGIVIHPTRPPESVDDEINIRSVLLPAVDQVGWNDTWAAWAAQRSIPVKINPHTGKNLAFAWQPLADLLQE